MTLPTEDTATLAGACHCGAVTFRLRLKGGFESARRCNCSYCGMRGAVAVSADLGELEILSGADRLNEYRFNTGQARHFFCSICGIYTHHQRRSNPSEFGVNVACLGVSPFDFREVPVMDGAHHSSDTGRNLQAGILRFMPTGV